MGMITALDKFYEVFDNAEMDDLFFDYDGISFILLNAKKVVLC